MQKNYQMELHHKYPKQNEMDKIQERKEEKKTSKKIK